jgi:hypothetical protein
MSPDGGGPVPPSASRRLPTHSEASPFSRGSAYADTRYRVSFDTTPVRANQPASALQGRPSSPGRTRTSNYRKATAEDVAESEADEEEYQSHHSVSAKEAADLELKKVAVDTSRNTFDLTGIADRALGQGSSFSFTSVETTFRSWKQHRRFALRLLAVCRTGCLLR